MSDALFPVQSLEPPSNARPGFRLQRLELYNWGTFDGRVEVLHLGGDNTLVTGDIGSGKSTLIDAVTTLLLPASRINYNKAAGAETRERSLRTYVLGHYKSERVESTGASRAVGLRDQRSYSVLLGVFRNDGFDTDVSLAQVFWMPGSHDQQPRRFFVTSDESLTIAGDFTDFGDDPADLKRRLRSRGAGVSDHFPEYGTRLRRLLGIRSEQALDLFHQTISMKSVGNLTEFVRHHMLEPADARPRISALVQHFEDLSRAHAAVSKARDQLAHLVPITAACDEHDDRADAIRRAEVDREAIPGWVAGHRLEVLSTTLREVRRRREEAEAEQRTADGRLQRLQNEQAGLRQARDGVAGGRLGVVESELRSEAERREERRGRASQVAALLASVDLPAPHDAAAFARVRESVMSRSEALQQSRTTDTARTADLTLAVREAERAGSEIAAELRSLRGRESNIDSRSLALRDRLAAELEVNGAELPFVGELIQVRPEYATWRGAAERLLRGFALSVLVPSHLYASAAAWVDHHHLGARFVYFRVAQGVTHRSSPPLEAPMLADVLDVRPGRHAAWVEEELRARADHVRVDGVEEFALHRRAITPQGQVKTDRRHEKDDRFAIDDRTRWVLGWSNADKVDALLDAAHAATERLGQAKDALAAAGQEADRRARESAVLSQLSAFSDWDQLDWHTSARRIEELQGERRRLEHGNAELAALQARLHAVTAEVTAAQSAAADLNQLVGGLEQRRRDLDADYARTGRTLEAIPDDRRAVVQEAYPRLDQRRPAPSTVQECLDVENALRDEITTAIEDDGRRQSLARERAAKLMAAFRQAWPSESTDLGADVRAGNEYRELHDRIATDDLPRFEAEFKRQLNTNTIHDIAGFQAWLDQSAQTIRTRIATINDSLGAIDYSPGTRITLLSEPSANQEVKAFRDDLRACTDDALSTDDQYSEERFRRVSAIIERFRGRAVFTEADRRWTEMVTDVRTWFVFAASECERATGAEREHYTDSDGKSGGQKEKLAYTILAASLAYQFGLEWGVPKSRDFRFTVIDEAFGRGSDASTRYALDLFRKLGLQLLVVTPLQKVHVIEPYINAVGFVENRTGQRSRLQTLTIEDYYAQREAHDRLIVHRAG